MAVDPRRERVAVAADGVPGRVEVVRPRGVAERVRRVRASGHLADRADCPARQTTAPGCGGSSSTISSTVTIERAEASIVSFWTPMMPQSWTLPCRSARCAWMIPTSGRSAGTAAALAGERAPDRPDRACARREVGAAVAAQHAERQARRHRPPTRPAIPAWSAPRCRAAAASRARRRRGSDAASRRRGCRPTRRQACARAHPDQLVVDQVRRHANERQLASRLADQLVPRSERDQVREALERDRVAVADERSDGLGEGRDLGHQPLPGSGGRRRRFVRIVRMRTERARTARVCQGRRTTAGQYPPNHTGGAIDARPRSASPAPIRCSLREVLEGASDPAAVDREGSRR